MLWAFLTAAFIGAVIRALARRDKRRQNLPPADDPRWAATSSKQVAGRRCAECGVKIVTASEGAPCDTCGEVAHVESCLEQHARVAHGPEPNVPYR